MNQSRRYGRTAMMVIMTLLALFVGQALAGEKTLVGEINDNYQLVVGDQTYDIADTAEGNELAENHISEKVQVVGTVEERDDIKIITVISYKVLSE